MLVTLWYHRKREEELLRKIKALEETVEARDARIAGLLEARSNRKRQDEETLLRWSDMAAFAEIVPAWPRIKIAKVWTDEVLPWLKRLFWENALMLLVEQDEKRKLMLQVRGMLLDGLIREPDVQAQMLQAQMDSQFLAGGDWQEKKEKE